MKCVGENAIDPAPFVAYCERRIAEGETWGQLAERCGYAYPDPRRPENMKAEGHVLKRRLGLAPESADGKGNPKRISTMLTYPMAVKIARGLDIDPVDVGI